MYYGYIMMRAIVVCPNLLCMYLCVCTFVCFVCSYVMLVSSALQFCFVYFSYALWYFKCISRSLYSTPIYWTVADIYWYCSVLPSVSFPFLFVRFTLVSVSFFCFLLFWLLLVVYKIIFVFFSCFTLSFYVFAFVFFFGFCFWFWFLCSFQYILAVIQMLRVRKKIVYHYILRYMVHICIDPHTCHLHTYIRVC